MKCPNCLNDLPNGALFCPVCGEKIIIQEPKNRKRPEEKEPEVNKTEGLSNGNIERMLKITSGLLVMVLVVLGLMILGVIKPMNTNKSQETLEAQGVEKETLQNDILTVVIAKDDNVKMLRCSGYPTKKLLAGETYILGELPEKFAPTQNIYAYMINNNDVCNIRLDITDGVVKIIPKTDISEKTGINIYFMYV